MSWLEEQLGKNQGLELAVKTLYYLGCWPPPAGTKQTPLDTFCKGLLEFSFFLVIFPNLLVIVHAVKSDGDTIVIIEDMTVVCGCTMLAAKGGTLLFLMERLQGFVARIQELVIHEAQEDSDARRREVIEDTQRRGNLLAGGIAVSLFMYLAGCLIRLVITYTNRRYWFKFWFPVDEYASPTYEIVMLLLSLQIVYSGLWLISLDGLLVAAYVQITGQLRLLGHDFSHIREDAVKKVTVERELDDDAVISEFNNDGESLFDSSPVQENKMALLDDFAKAVDSEMCRRYGQCVSRHQEIIRLTRELEDLFNPMMTNQLMCNVVPTVLGIVLITRFQLTDDFAAAVVGLSSMALCELWLLCYLADLLTEQAEGIREAVLDCDWFEASEPFKRSMRITMSQCNQGLAIRVAGFVPLSGETFLSIVNIIYSYYTTLSATMETEH